VVEPGFEGEAAQVLHGPTSMPVAGYHRCVRV
jgi:hypothetical protein